MPTYPELQGTDRVLLIRPTREAEQPEVREIPVVSNAGVARRLASTEDFGVVGFIRLADGQDMPTPDAQVVFVDPKSITVETVFDHADQTTKALRVVTTRTGGLHVMGRRDKVTFSSPATKNAFRYGIASHS